VSIWLYLITEKEGAPAKMQTNGTTEAEQKKDNFWRRKFKENR
jgi:hypothetical protein